MTSQEIEAGRWKRGEWVDSERGDADFFFKSKFDKILIANRGEIVCRIKPIARRMEISGLKKSG